MAKRSPPGQQFDLGNLPSDPQERHQAFVDLLGQYIFWMRNWAVARSEEIINDEAVRMNLGTIKRKRFDGIAEMNEDDRKAAVAFSEATVDAFCDLLLRFLGNEGYDIRIGSGEAVQALLEFHLIDMESGDITEKHIVNRGGTSMPEYWGRWLNRFRNS